METSEAIVGNVTVLTMKGRLDHLSSPEAERKLLGLVDGGVRLLVLDLSHLNYVSSVGLRALILAAKKLKASNGSLAVAALMDGVRMVFKIAGLESAFPTYASVGEATTALNATAPV